MNKSLYPYLLVSAFLACASISFGQVYKVINYECLDTPLEILNANHDNTITYCTEGLLQIDTLEEDCYEFYEEDGNVFRAWYYNDLDSEGNIQFDFDRITLHENDEWPGEISKYFEVVRAGFWLTLPSMETPESQFALKLKDLSGVGVNVGFSMEDGAIYFPNLEAVVNADFPDLNITYTNEILTVEGSVRNLFIGGDHLYFGQLELSELVTSTTTVEKAKINFFPNPTANIVHIESDLLIGAQVKIYSAPGALHTSKSSTNRDIDLDVSGLPNGVFWIQIWKNQELLHVEPISKF